MQREVASRKIMIEAEYIQFMEMSVSAIGKD
jgi:hypothetical protein